MNLENSTQWSQQTDQATSLQLPYYLKPDQPTLSHEETYNSKANPAATNSRSPRPGSGPGTESSVDPVYVLGIPMHRLSRPLQFVICFCGVVVFYLLYGYSQEWIFRDEIFKAYGWYLTLVQFGFYTVFGLVERCLQKEWHRRIPMTTYLLIGFLTVATMGLSNTSLGYLNYPTQVIFKSCKLIPVMIGGVLIQGKRYTLLDVVSMCLMCLGLVFFNLTDVSILPKMDNTGILLVSLALCADAIIGNVQEKALKGYSASSLEMVLYSYSIGMLYIFIGVLLSGSLLPPFYYCFKNPKIYMVISIFSLTGYLGVNFVLALVKSFGALVAVTVTTFRKTITVVLSFLLFTKPFSQQYVWSGLLVLLGIFLNAYSKNSKTFELQSLRSKVFHLLLQGAKVIPSSKQLQLSLLKSMKGQESSDGVTPDHCGGGDDNLTTLRANSSIHNFSLDGSTRGALSRSTSASVLLQTSQAKADTSSMQPVVVKIAVP